MNNNYEFSIVIFAAEQEGFLATYESLRRQQLHEEVQILIVPTQPGVFEAACFERLKKDEHACIVKPDQNGDIMHCLKENIRGTYLSFTKGGMIYSDKALKQILKHGKNRQAVIVTQVLAEEGINRVLREHNAYCRRYRSNVSLETNSYLLHSVYMGYFIPSALLSWQDGILLDDWYYGVMRIIFETATRCPRLVCAKQELIHTQNGRAVFEEWDKTFGEPEGIARIFTQLLCPLKALAEAEETVYHRNAGYVLLYYTVRLMKSVSDIEELGEEQAEKYRQFADEVLRKLCSADYVIANQYINKINKKYLLETYFPEAVSEQREGTESIVRLENVRTNIQFFEVQGDSVHIEFVIMFPFHDVQEVFCSNGEQYIPCQRVKEMITVKWGTVDTGIRYLYTVDVPLLKTKNHIRWYVEVSGEKLVMKGLGFRRYTPFTKSVFLYKKIEERLMYLNREKDGVEIVPYRASAKFPLYVKQVISFVRRGMPGCKALAARLVFHRRKKKLKKQVWLVSDRTNRGDDNGEVMFRYLCEHAAEDIEPWFVIDRDTPDWEEMQKLGKVVAPFSKQHKLLFLLSEFSLSSQANKAVVNPFGRLEYLYRDLMYDKRLVFLQHGITKDNQSAWLNKYNRNLFGFVVTTQPEYDSVFEYDYYYEKDRVWLTGMPRYDRLYHDEKRYVTIMPTWRKSLSAGTDSEGVWLLGEEFSESEYFHFYNSLLNHERLLEAAEQYGYTVCFMPHPNTISGIGLFGHDKRVRFLDATNSYKDVFAQTDLMVTDYSSVAFDFAYLRKPIVYAQFDKEEFFNGEHSYTEGYFDYERDGFGEVEYDLESTVSRVIEYMANDCKMKPEYIDRIDKTFAFNDRDCSKRVYEMILKYRT